MRGQSPRDNKHTYKQSRAHNPRNVYPRCWIPSYRSDTSRTRGRNRCTGVYPDLRHNDLRGLCPLHGNNRRSNQSRAHNPRKVLARRWRHHMLSHSRRHCSFQLTLPREHNKQLSVIKNGSGNGCRCHTCAYRLISGQQMSSHSTRHCSLQLTFPREQYKQLSV